MRPLLRRVHAFLPTALAALTLVIVGVLLAVDVVPVAIGRRVHDILGALPLGLIAVAYLAHQTVLRPAPKEVLKTVLVAAAFLFWSANLVWPDPFVAMLFGDVAIALFVFDVFLVIIGWPPTPPDEGFGETSRDLAR